MYFIIFDLEFNQDVPSIKGSAINNKFPFEIIQIGAIKLDFQLNVIDTFNQYIKPTIYSKINSFITELTGITTEQLLDKKTFVDVYDEYIKFISNSDSIFCTWGMSDINELYKNADYYKLDVKLLPKMFINIQPYVSVNLGLSQKKLLCLQNAVESFNIPTEYKFHNALHDAYYTSEIFKKIYDSTVQPKVYDPSYIAVKPRQKKKVIDFESLIFQFEKMYNRKMKEEEQNIIKLAYKMGKTNQFLK